MYDVIIIGSGVAGLAAAIYTTRYTLETLIIGGDFLGGDTAKAFSVENYPGFEKITGLEMINKIVEQVKKLGAELVMEVATEARRIEGGFEVKTNAGKSYQGKTIILTHGLKRRKLPVPGAKEYENKGVQYCATCDGPLFIGKTIAVVGGGDAGAESAVYLADMTPKVYLVVREAALNAEPFWQDLVKKTAKVEVLYQTQIKEIKGEGMVSSIVLDQPYQGKSELSVQGVFVEIGSEPDVALEQQLSVELDQRKQIVVKPDQSTSLEGVFAAGDATTESNQFRQILPAMAEGVIAANSIFKYLKS